jgi:hypothetical protein
MAAVEAAMAGLAVAPAVEGAAAALAELTMEQRHRRRIRELIRGVRVVPPEPPVPAVAEVGVTYSDGGMKRWGDARKATYAWLETEAEEHRNVAFNGKYGIYGDEERQTVARAEALALFRALFEGPLVSGRARRQLHYMDRQGAVKIFNRLEKMTPRGWRLLNNQDVWRAVAEWLDTHGWDVATVRWVRSHVEKLKERPDWTQEDWGNYLADCAVNDAWDERARNQSWEGMGSDLPASRHGRWSFFRRTNGVELVNATRAELWKQSDDMRIRRSLGPEGQNHSTPRRMVAPDGDVLSRALRKLAKLGKEDASTTLKWELDVLTEDIEALGPIKADKKEFTKLHKFLFGKLPDQNNLREWERTAEGLPAAPGVVLDTTCVLCKSTGATSNRHTLLECTAHDVVVERREWLRLIHVRLDKEVKVLGAAAVERMRRGWQLSSSGAVLNVAPDDDIALVPGVSK